MKLQVDEYNEILLTEVYSGVGFKTEDGEFLGVAMRDTGFEFNYNGTWYEAKKGIVRKLGTEKEISQNESVNSKIMKEKIESFIARIRDSFIGSQQVYTEGSCYHFHLILKEVFPEAEPWYDQDHIITQIEGRFYDITGEVVKNSNMLKYDSLPYYSLKAPYNIYRNINR